jgi:hypothetical protein
MICLPNVLKCNFGDVDEAMFHDVERPYEHIFFLLSMERSHSDEVA